MAAAIQLPQVKAPRRSAVVALLCVLAIGAAADEHPLAGEIRAYLAGNPIDGRLPEMTAGISDRSLSLNQKGYEAYAAKRYPAALDLFRRAILEDDGNSLAYYNAACVMALQFPALPQKDKEAAEMEILRFLFQAVERHWYWAVQQMVDPDLDAVRQIWPYASNEGQQVTLSEDFEYGSVYNVLADDGTVSLRSNRPDFEGGSGWYCYIGPYVFEFLPFAFPRIGGPPVENAVYVFPFERLSRPGEGR